MEKNLRIKKLRIPLVGNVDILPILPIINTGAFQRLSEVSQLGSNVKVFLGGRHSRAEHMLGAYKRTLIFTQRMVSLGLLKPKEALNVSLFALTHDIGHGPFSHVIEEVTSIDHEENGLRVLDSIKNEIQMCGGDFGMIKSMLKRKNPLWKIVMDKNLGLEKLDYLSRDVYHIGFGSGIDVESIFDYLFFINGEMVVEKKQQG